MISEVFLIDCLEYMKTCESDIFDLAIVDPPYGINFGNFNRTNKDAYGNRYKSDKYKNSNWDDSIPDDQYFMELKRVSKNQIIWGGNYFPQLWDAPCKGFIFWHKQNPVDNFSDGELAWTSFDKPAKCFNYKYFGNIQGNTSAEKKIHPTQKPKELYKWILHNYAKKGDKIFDSHMGSQSSRLAAWDMGFDFWGTELDADYFSEGNKRFNNFKIQNKLF